MHIEQRDLFLEGYALRDLQGFFERQVSWTFGWQSNRDKVPFGHWNHDFLGTSRTNQVNADHVLFEDPDLQPLRSIWQRLKQEVCPDHHLVRCYANAHTFGVEGFVHTDSRLPGNYTAIIYVNPAWQPEWAGETVFLNDEGDICKAVLPKPGRLVFFDGRVRHAARALSRVCPALRVTLMFKTKAPGAENDPE
jgi:hypothetical protein